jgi:putative ABC transport system substrate-binding protein
MMSRRRFLRTVTASLLAAPLGAEAQQAAGRPRIGWLTSSVIHEANVHAFRDGMRGLGHGEVAIEFRAADGHTERIGALAADLVRLKVDVIVVDGGAAAVVVKQAIRDIPVVVGVMGDPLRQGLVASLARPGGNLTGFSISTGPELIGKRLGLLREVVPELTRVGLVWNETNAMSRAQLEDAQHAARTLAITIASLGVRDTAGIGHAFGEAVRTRAAAVLTIADAFLWSQRGHIVALARRHQLPAMYPESEFVTAGGLLAYGPNVPDNFRRAAGYVDRILKGARPGDLPIERPTKFDLAINLGTARALGITIPSAVLLQATMVIE